MNARKKTARIFLFVLLSVICSLKTGFGQDQAIMELIKEGAAYAEKGETSLAMAAFTEAIKLDPQNPIVLRCLGLLYDRQGLYIKAVHNYNKAFDYAENEKAREMTSFLIHQSIEKFRSASLAQDGTLTDERLQNDIMQRLITQDKAIRPSHTAQLVAQKVMNVVPWNGQPGMYEINEEWVVDCGGFTVVYSVKIFPSAQGGSDYLVALKE